MALIVKPAACRAVIADSRPEPGPLTRTSISFSRTWSPARRHVSAARWAAKGVLLRLPLKPTVPAEAKHKRVAVGIGDRHDGVVKGRLDVGDAPADVATLLCVFLSWPRLAPCTPALRADSLLATFGKG